MTEYESGDIVLCTVESISKTIVFVTLEDGTQGSIVMSEISPGRIRNIRDFVVPKKKIVCKVLRILSEGNLGLSLRRVTQKETKELLQEFKQEKTSQKIITSMLDKDADEIISKIKEKSSVSEFLQSSKEDPKELEKLVGKEKAKKILDIIKTQKKKKTEIKKEFKLSTIDENGLETIKTLLSVFEKQAEIKYLAGGKYSIKIKSEDLKKADKLAKEILESIEDQAKKEKIEFSTKEKK